MTIKAIIEMMDKLGFSNTAKHRVSYDLLESSMYILVEGIGTLLIIIVRHTFLNSYGNILYKNGVSY